MRSDPGLSRLDPKGESGVANMVGRPEGTLQRSDGAPRGHPAEVW